MTNNTINLDTETLNAIALDKAQNPAEYGVTSFDAYWGASVSASWANHVKTGNVR